MNVHRKVCRYVHVLSVCLSLRLSFHLSVPLSLSVCLSQCLSFSLSLSLPPPHLPTPPLFVYQCLFVNLNHFKHDTIPLQYDCHTNRPPPRYQVIFTDNKDTVERITPVSSGTEQPTQFKPFLAPLLANHRVTALDHFQDVRLVQLDISSSCIKWGCDRKFLLSLWV